MYRVRCKEGAPSDPNNYRGITLGCCFAKLVTVILNKRLQKWAQENYVLTDAQFGCKRNNSTVDVSFILNSLIEKQFKDNNNNIAVSSIFKKAYDMTDGINL